jgi:Lipase (class 3)
MVVFRGTESNLFQEGEVTQDWLSNVDMDAVTIPNSTCEVHEGYYQAYHNFEYKQQVEDFIYQCQTDCPDCDVVLTGHSQGGSIATIVAIDLLLQQQSTTRTIIDPYVITFGSPQGLGAECLPLVNALSPSGTCRWYHYIVSIDGSFGLTYDIVPMLFPTLLTGMAKYANNGFGFLGHELLLSSQNVDSLVYIGKDTHQFGMPYSGRAHYPYWYSGVLQQMVERSTTSNSDSGGIIPTTGFMDGTLCNRDDECISRRCSKQNWLDRNPQCESSSISN